MSRSNKRRRLEGGKLEIVRRLKRSGGGYAVQLPPHMAVRLGSEVEITVDQKNRCIIIRKSRRTI